MSWNEHFGTVWAMFLGQWGVVALFTNLGIAWLFRGVISEGWTNWTRFFLAVLIGYTHVALYSFVVTLTSWPVAGAFLGLYYGFKIAPLIIPMSLAAYWIMRWADRNDRTPRPQRQAREAPVL